MKHVLIAHDIRSVHNVGSLFRIADCAGIGKLYITGHTPAPLDRFGRVRSDLHKTALGAEEVIPWEQAEDPKAVLESLKKDGYKVVGIEQSDRSVDYKTIAADAPIAFVLGREVEGIDPAILALCDEVAEIPMRGQKESLNVSVAAGIVIFRILNI